MRETDRAAEALRRDAGEAHVRAKKLKERSEDVKRRLSVA